MTNKQLFFLEVGVENLAKSDIYTDKEWVEIIQDGLAMKYKGNLPTEIQEMMNELISTFDVY